MRRNSSSLIHEEWWSPRNSFAIQRSIIPTTSLELQREEPHWIFKFYLSFEFPPCLSAAGRRSVNIRDTRESPTVNRGPASLSYCWAYHRHPMRLAGAAKFSVVVLEFNSTLSLTTHVLQANSIWWKPSPQIVAQLRWQTSRLSDHSWVDLSSQHSEAEITSFTNMTLIYAQSRIGSSIEGDRHHFKGMDIVWYFNSRRQSYKHPGNA